MRSFHNIEKSGFHRGQYVGYAHGRVYHIVKQQPNSSYPYYRATLQNPTREDMQHYTFAGTTLELISAKLAQLPDPYAIAKAA